MMRKNNNNRNNNMKHRGNNNGGGARRYQSGGGGGNGGGSRGGHDSGNIARQKHHATQQLGKYGDMARNAQINGDRVDVEYYLQHVDHYTRVLAEVATIEAERYAHQRESQIIPGGPNDPAYQQQQHQPPSETSDAGAHAAVTDAAPAAESSHAPAPSADFTPAEPRAPRPPRQPRRSHYSAPQESGNGAAEANSNTTEIPLPGGILPPV